MTWVAAFLILQIFNVVLCDYKGSTSVDSTTYYYYADGSDNAQWCTAQMRCMNQPFPMIMACIKNADVDTAISSLLAKFGNRETWVGGNDLASERSWLWIDGTPFTYTNWYTNEPNNADGTEGCLQLNEVTVQSQGRWNDEECEFRYGFVCQLGTNKMISSDYSQLTVFGSAESRTTFFGAKKECENIGARLVQIGDEQTKESILKKIQGNKDSTEFWINTRNSQSGCSVLKVDRLEERGCVGEARGFICETAAPHLLRVSNEHPIVVSGGNLEINCNVNGYPIPEVVWERDGKSVSNQVKGNGMATLIIKDAAQTSTGRYQCVATNNIDGKSYLAMGFTEVKLVEKADELKKRT